MELVKQDSSDQITIDKSLLNIIFNRAKKPRIKLNNWYWDRPLHMAGDAENHPIFGNRFIKTSKLVYVDLERGIAESRNTVYELGAPHGS